LQDFPIDYAFCGTLTQVQKQIGNAVPIKLASALAAEVAKYFERKNLKGEIEIASYFKKDEDYFLLQQKICIISNFHNRLIVNPIIC